MERTGYRRIPITGIMDRWKKWSSMWKTMLRQLISKWGIMSIDMMSAMDADMAVINDDGTKTYVDNDSDAEIIDMEQSQEEKTESSERGQSAAAALFGN